MTTNEIEKQLRAKASQKINEHADLIVKEMADFGKGESGYNRNGMHWYQRHYKPVKRFTSDPEPDDPWNHLDWEEFKRLIVRNMKETFLESMVEMKTKELLSKIDLFE